MKNIYLDLETTGTSLEKHGVLQIAGIIEIDDIVKEEFNFFTKPFPTDLVDPEALMIHGLTVDQIKKYPDPNEVYGNLVELFGKYADKYNSQDKFFMIGYNTHFDMDHLRNFFNKNEDEFFGSWFWWPGIDVAVLAVEILKERRHKFPDFKLSTVCDILDIEIDAHDALSDARCVRKIYKKLFE